MNSRRSFLAVLALSLTPRVLLAAESSMEAGTRAFMAGKMDEALRDWDRQIAEDPAAGPHHWQRGLALYYAGRFREGRVQFESHQAVNSQDVENAAWHFLCVAKLESPEAARRAFIPITSDTRVPLKEVHALYAGKGSAAEVLAAADLSASEGALRNQRCYAHLYLGLYSEALGDSAKAKEHLTLAAGKYRMDHYMGQVATVHCRLRGWSVPA